MSDLRGNTILGTVLAAGLTIMGLRIGGESLFEAKYPEPGKAGIDIDISAFASAAASSGPAKAEEGPVDWGRVLADPALVEAGAVVAKKCATCHNFDDGGPNSTGPNLHGVVGRAPASHPGFNYSAAMKGVTEAWGYDHLNRFLTSPGKEVKGTAMTFVGLKKSDERMAMIAYLRSISPGAPALPAPLPEQGAAAPAEAVPAAGAAPAP